MKRIFRGRHFAPCVQDNTEDKSQMRTEILQVTKKRQRHHQFCDCKYFKRPAHFQVVRKTRLVDIATGISTNLVDELNNTQRSPAHANNKLPMIQVEKHYHFLVRSLHTSTPE
uniref:Uncharacterized protein n=1 Tax=Caenorhabditis japonica TaxID=281687 RepID=A0A8R1EAB7_CAEJA